MKTKLTALTLSACLLGWSTASPEGKSGEPSAEFVPAAQQAEKAHPHVKVDVAANAARKDRVAEHAKKEEERKAARASIAKKREEDVRQAAEAKKAEESKKALAAAEVKKADEAKKAQVEAAKKKAEDEKVQKAALAHLQELNTQRKNAEANRIKAAEVLKASERKLEAIGSEIKRVNGELKAQAEADQRKSEMARARRIRESDAQQQATILNMKTEIRQLKQSVELLTRKGTEKKSACAPVPMTR